MADPRKQLRWSQLKVGGVITVALIILLVALFFAGGIEKIFYPKTELRVQFQDVKGLRIGAPVWIRGTEVGSVRDIDLDPVHGTIVTISIHRNVLGLIGKDATASILTMGLLGDKYIDLNAGSQSAEPIQPKALIKGIPQMEFTDVVGASAATMERMNEFIKKVDILVTKLGGGEGTVAKLIADPEIYDNLKKSTRSLSILTDEIRDSRGTLKMLMEDPSLYNRMAAAASSIEELGSSLSKSPGTLRKLLEDPSLYDRILSATASIEQFSKSLNKTGTLTKFLEDPSLYDKVVTVTSDMEGFTKKLRENQGTLHKMVEDPELYDNLNRVSKTLASILTRVDQGQGLAGTLIQDDQIAKDFREALAKLKEVAVEMEGLTGELKTLTKDIKENPKKYFKFSLF